MDFYSDSFYSSLLNYEEVVTNMTYDFLDAETKYISRNEDLEFVQNAANIWLHHARISIRNITVWTPYNNGTYYNLGFDSTPLNWTLLRASSAHAKLPENPFWDVTTRIWTRFTTLRNAYYSVVSSLDALLGGLYTDLTDSIVTIQGNQYTLRKALLAHVAPLLRAQCDFCANDAGDALVDIVKTKLTTELGPLQTTLEAMLNSVEQTYIGFLSALANGNTADQNSIRNTDVPNIVTSAENLWDSMNDELYDTLKTSTGLLEELLRHMRPKCLELSMVMPEKVGVVIRFQQNAGLWLADAKTSANHDQALGAKNV